MSTRLHFGVVATIRGRHLNLEAWVSGGGRSLLEGRRPIEEIRYPQTIFENPSYLRNADLLIALLKSFLDRE